MKCSAQNLNNKQLENAITHVVLLLHLYSICTCTIWCRVIRCHQNVSDSIWFQKLLKLCCSQLGIIITDQMIGKIKPWKYLSQFLKSAMSCDWRHGYHFKPFWACIDHNQKHAALKQTSKINMNLFPGFWITEPKDVLGLVKAFHELIGRGHSSERLQQYLSQFWATKNGFWQQWLGCPTKCNFPQLSVPSVLV